MWCDVMWCDVMWCDVMWCDAMWCDVMLCYVMWCDAMLCYVMWCDVMWFVCFRCSLSDLQGSFLEPQGLFLEPVGSILEVKKGPFMVLGEFVHRIDICSKQKTNSSEGATPKMMISEWFMDLFLECFLMIFWVLIFCEKNALFRKVMFYLSERLIFEGRVPFGRVHGSAEINKNQ